MNMMKKILCMIIALAMCMPLCLTAFAADEAKESEQKAHDVEIKLVEVDRESFTRKHIGKAGGQPAGGYILPTGSYLTWTPGGYSEPVTLSVGWGIFSFAFDVGSASTGTVGTVVPALPNEACWLHVYKDLTVIRYEVYQRPAGTSWAWSPTGEYVTHVYEGALYLQCRAY